MNPGHSASDDARWRPDDIAVSDFRAEPSRYTAAQQSISLIADRVELLQ